MQPLQLNKNPKTSKYMASLKKYLKTINTKLIIYGWLKFIKEFQGSI